MKLKWLIPLFLLGCIIIMSLLAPVITPYPPNEVHMERRLQQPSQSHLFGTDALGRDVLSRMIYGGRQSLLVAFFATLMALVIGIVVGFLSGYYGGRIDFVMTSLSNIFLGIPGISIMIAFVGVLGPSVKSLLLAIVINSWVGFSRIVRGEVMAIKNEYYIEATKNMGAKDWWIFVRHILPNLSDSLIILFVSRVGTVILSVAALSYLGLGLQPPTPDWAIMISDARPYFRSYPLLVLGPGGCIIVFVWSVLTIGDAIRDHLDIGGGRVE